MNSPPDIVILTLRAEGAGPPLPIRVRGALKRLLRNFGLRAVDVQMGKSAVRDAARASERGVTNSTEQP